MHQLLQVALGTLLFVVVLLLVAILDEPGRRERRVQQTLIELNSTR